MHATNCLFEDDKHLLAVWLFEDEERGIKVYILQEDTHLKEFPSNALCELKLTVSLKATHYAMNGYEKELVKNEL